jgi:hypothetical protein
MYWVQNLGQYHRIVVLGGAQFRHFILNEQNVRMGQASLLKLDDPNFSNHIAKNTIFDVLQNGIKFQIENVSY